MRVASSAGLVALLCVPLAGQSTPPTTFEVADVRQSVPAADGPPALSTAVRIGVPRNGRYEIRRATMVDLIRTAYGVEAEKVIGGPPWLEMDRFDVKARVPASASRDSVMPMLQALLADRFGLVVRQEIKPVAGHALVRTSGELRMKEAVTAGTCQQNIQTSTAAGALSLSLTMACRGVSMAALTEQLTRSPSLTGVTGPVVDASGLAGGYDFDLQFAPTALTATTGGQTFSQALANVGLKLEAKDVPLLTITVERVNKSPTPNDAAAVAAAFPPEPPLEFEVADIKPSLPGGRPGIQNLPNGQLRMTAVPLRTLIGLAWNPPNAASIVGPRGLDNTFDLVAKASVNTVSLDPEVIGPMLQKLLIDSLNLKVRWEERQIKGYSLVADKNHKLVKSDPASRTRCAQPAAAARPVSAGGPMQTLNCQNMTMGEFAAQLQRIGGSYFEVPVLDETGIEGRWNFSISFSPPGLAQALASARAVAGAPQAATGGVGSASDPTGVMTIEEAVDRQMGLKLRARQRTGRALVVDYVEDKPTPNN
jgi:uncharacterized protein (TIGR03435 family)